MADSRRCLGMTKTDPKLPFKVAVANVGYWIGKRPFNYSDKKDGS